MPGWKRRPSYNKADRIDYDPEKQDYTARELERLADQFLRDDARSVDAETGKERGIGGENPILFDEHLYQRQKREILNENGVPEPSLISGIYGRSHPEGRKVNSEEQRRKNGASYYRHHEAFTCSWVDVFLSVTEHVSSDECFDSGEIG